jgi:tetratricopeptide (TPR) repeat protein
VPTPLEAEISSLLSEKGDARLVAEDLLHRWKHRMLSSEEQIDCAQFLVAAGLYSVLFRWIHQLAGEQEQIPWAQLLEAIGRTGLGTDEFETSAILEGAKIQQATSELVRSHRLDAQIPDLAKIRVRLRSQKEMELQQRLQALKEKLTFMRSNRLFEQEAEVIREIQSLFPEQTEAAAELKSLQFRWAREIVSKSEAITDVTADLHWKINKLTPEQLTAKGIIVERAMEFASNDPRLAYDLALCLHAMDFNAEAVEILNHASHLGRSSQPADWLRLELMIQARQFVNALEEANRLEVVYAGDPEASFATVYTRARALHGLGQTAMAVDLLRSLVRIRPNYKSAQSLLLDWSGGDV